MSSNQLDMFEAQDELFVPEPVVFRPDPDRVRRRLERILAEARAAESMPWDRARRRFYEKIVPQMTLALPEAEAARLRLAFETEMARLA